MTAQSSTQQIVNAADPRGLTHIIGVPDSLRDQIRHAQNHAPSTLWSTALIHHLLTVLEATERNTLAHVRETHDQEDRAQTAEVRLAAVTTLLTRTEDGRTVTTIPAGTDITAQMATALGNPDTPNNI